MTYLLMELEALVYLALKSLAPIVWKPQMKSQHIMDKGGTWERISMYPKSTMNSKNAVVMIMGNEVCIYMWDF